MTAQIISLKNNEDAALELASAALSRGEPIGLPTETVYGLAADATNPDAISAIFEAKGRPRFNPLISHMADLAMAERHVVFNDLARLLAEKFWPGALTLVLPLAHSSAIHPLATAGLETAAIRVPEGFAGRLIAHYGKPLAAPSANPSGKISPTSAAHVAGGLGERIGLILDGGPTSIGVESTIVQVKGERITLLRPGGVPAEEIEAATGLRLARLSGSARVNAPGMLSSHYAPEAGLILDALGYVPGEALIDFGGQIIAGKDEARLVLDLSPTANLREAAANLFDYLKQADASGAPVIRVAPVPQTGLGEAINDRLRRAAAPRE